MFNIRGNDYRLVVAVDFDKGIVWIKWLAPTVTTIGSTREGWSMSDLRPIRTEADYGAALAEVERLWGARSGTAGGDRLDILATLADAYESEHFPMDPPDPIDAIRFRMEQQGLSRKDEA